MQTSFKIIDLEQRSSEWLRYRKTHIGASDSPIILGQSPYKTPLELYEEKIYEKISVTISAMQLGHNIEPLVRNLAGLELCEIFTPRVCESLEFPWLSASLDGMNEAGTCIIEIKYNNFDVHTRCIERSVIPAHHFIQIQHQLAVTNLSFCYYFSYNNGETIYLKIDRDDEVIEKLISETKEFYNRIINLDAPSHEDRDYIEIFDQNIIDASKKYEEKLLEMNLLHKELNELKELLTKNEHPRLKIGNLRLIKYFRKGPIEYSKIPELAEIDLEKFRKEGKFVWKIVEDVGVVE